MLKLRLIVLLCISFCVLFLSNCTSKRKAEVKNFDGINISKDSLASHINTKMQELKIPGASFALINDGVLVHHQTFGYANLEQKLLVTESTIFEGASISKSVFSFFVMKYVEEGKLDLDKPLYKYLEYPDISHDERYKKITARMVLSHRSGFPNWRENEPDEKLKIKFDPGTNFEYSGEGYQYLAMVLKKIEGGTWANLEKAFQNKVANPIGMKHTVFIPTQYIAENKASPYDKDNNWIDLNENYWYKKEKGMFVAPSSIHTEAVDFSKWMITVMNKEQLSEDSYDELLKSHSPLHTDGGVSYFYSLGFASGDQHYKNTYFHSGSNDGFTCWYVLNTEKDWGFVIFTNSEHGIALGEYLFEYLSQNIP